MSDANPLLAAAGPSSGATDENVHVRFFSDELMTELGQVLVERELVTTDQVEELNSRRVITGKSLDLLLREERLVDDADLVAALSAVSNIPVGKLGDYTIDPAIAAKVASRTALRYRVMPLHDAEGALTLATCTVPTHQTSDGLRMLLDTAIEWVLCTENELLKSLTHFYGLGAETIDELIAEAAGDDDVDKTTDVTAVTADTGMVKFINLIIAEAIRMDATDIHIEPFETTVRLRYRIDGLLQEIPLPKNVGRIRRAVSSTVKVMANMDIAERRKPHDGRIKVKTGSHEYDLRVSVLPTNYGETVNMRILNRSSMLIDLEKLGLTEHLMPKIRRLTEVPHGVVLLTGPTGSGKTTTLYALLSRVSTIDRKIITVEDPIEYQMQGINQIQVHSKIDLTFANILRSILRHDPDVILIGEIRDSETADIAVRSSLTGHLVFSTLHTNDAPSAITRLSDMGVEPYLISSCLEGVIAQRLVRRACAACAHSVELPPEIYDEIAHVYPDHIGKANFIAGRGCPTCNFTSYRGRCAISEVMMMTDNIRAMVVSRQPANLIKQEAVAEGMFTLRQDGWMRVIQGRSTVEEIFRVAGKQE
jgi:type II secretory ATPase GspE/PulE/Tfp pilus assembly ATPase PilB-like protein